MPYRQKSGQYNQLTWFLTDDEIAFLRNNNHLENRVLFAAFNDRFQCNMSYSRMRHFQAQYKLQKQEKGAAYTDEEKAFVLNNYETMSTKHIGEALGRTTKSIEKLMRVVLNLKRSKEGTQRLRRFRSQSGAAGYHARIKKGELQHPAVALEDGFVAGVIKRRSGITEVPESLIKLKRAELKINRVLKELKHDSTTTQR